jgi:hypothetical protein
VTGTSMPSLEMGVLLRAHTRCRHGRKAPNPFARPLPNARDGSINHLPQAQRIPASLEYKLTVGQYLRNRTQ